MKNSDSRNLMVVIQAV